MNAAVDTGVSWDKGGTTGMIHEWVMGVDPEMVVETDG